MLTEYIVLDLETTGLDPKKHKIIEIAAVHVKNHKIIDRYQTLINPGWRLEETITELTGLTDDDLVSAPMIEDKIGEFLEFIGDRVIMGHSVLFDYSFLKRAAVNQGFGKKSKNFIEHAQAIDTLKIARKYLPDLPSRGLHALCLHYGIEHQAHRAMTDVEATHALYQRLCQEFCTEKTADDFLPIELHYQVKREGPITKAQKERLLRIISQHHIVPRFDVDRLTKNEASRIIDKIILTYGK